VPVFDQNYAGVLNYFDWRIEAGPRPLQHSLPLYGLYHGKNIGMLYLVEIIGNDF
jgi:hypothetical protein